MWENIKYHFVEFSKTFFPDLGLFLLKLVIIITAIIIILEILKAFKILDYINKIIYVFFKPLGISRSASMPLLIGIIFGITYGAGAILASYSNHDMNKKDLYLVSTFLCLCHALPEDTLLFSSVNAIGWLIALIRIVLAVVVTIIVRLIYEKIEKKKDLHMEDKSCEQ